MMLGRTKQTAHTSPKQGEGGCKTNRTGAFFESTPSAL
jgi:hypothetical protein